MTYRRAIALLLVVTLLLLAVLVLVQSRILVIRSKDVVFQSGDVTLHGTLVLPRRGAPPYPAAVLVHGSGSTTRKGLRAWGGKLAPAGMALLIYDQRGTGESTGKQRSWAALTCAPLLNELTQDALAGLQFLKTHEDIDATRLGMVGGSQAGWIMPLAASWSDDVRYFVSLSGPSVSCAQVDLYQELNGVASSASPALEETDEIREKVAAHTGPNGYDPRLVLEDVQVPSLWLYGGRDRRVPSRLCMSILDEVATLGRAEYTVELIPGADHDFHDPDSGRLLDPWPAMHAWLTEQGILSP